MHLYTYFSSLGSASAPPIYLFKSEICGQMGLYTFHGKYLCLFPVVLLFSYKCPDASTATIDHQVCPPANLSSSSITPAGCFQHQPTRSVKYVDKWAGDSIVIFVHATGHPQIDKGMHGVDKSRITLTDAGLNQVANTTC